MPQSSQQSSQQLLQQSPQQTLQLQADASLATTIEISELMNNHESAVPEIDIASDVSKAYEEIVLWRKNMFDLPKGHVGKLFVAQMTALVDSWNNRSPKMKYAMKALMIMPAFVAKDISESKEQSKQGNSTKETSDVGTEQIQ